MNRSLVRWNPSRSEEGSIRFLVVVVVRIARRSFCFTVFLPAVDHGRGVAVLDSQVRESSVCPVRWNSEFSFAR
jgi:hypothetical protein